MDVNLAALSLLLSGCVQTLAKVFSHPLHWWDSSSGRLEKGRIYVDGESQCGFLFSCDNIYAWDVENAWLISLTWIFVVDKWKTFGFHA
jgi:hypothetical protein